MFWQEDENKQEIQVTDEVVDLLFNIDCRELPVNHIYPLSVALQAQLPWLTEEPRAAIHEVHVAGSQNGWERPDPAQGQKLILSRRTKLTLRMPKHRVGQVQQELDGVTLDIDGHPMTIGKAKPRLLSKQGTIFCRNLALEEGEEDDEDAFMQRIADELGRRRIRLTKALPGITTRIETPDGIIAARSIMISDLKTAESIDLQMDGIGSHRLLGCGIFLPHKGIDAVKQQGDD